MAELYLKSTELDKYNSRGDFLHLDVDYGNNAVRLDFDSSTALTLDDGSIIIGLNVTHQTGLSSGKATLSLPFPVCFTLHGENVEYEMFDMEEYKKSKDAKAAKKKVKQHPLEALLLKAIGVQGIDFSTPKRGFISISSSPNDDSFIDGTFPLEKYKFCDVIPCEDGFVDPLKGKKLSAANTSGGASGGRGGYNAQTELAKLFDRQNVIKTVSNAWLNNVKGTDIKVDDCATASLMSEALNDPNLREYLSLIMGIELPVRVAGVPEIGKTF